MWLGRLLTLLLTRPLPTWAVPESHPLRTCRSRGAAFGTGGIADSLSALHALGVRQSSGPLELAVGVATGRGCCSSARDVRTGSLHGGELQVEGCAAVGVVGGGEVALVCLGDPPGEGEAEAVSG